MKNGTDNRPVFLCFDLIPVFAEGFRRYPVGLLKELIKIRYGRKTYIITNRKNGVVGILQLKSRLLQTNLVQIFGHGIPGILPEAAAKIGFVEMERF